MKAIQNIRIFSAIFFTALLCNLSANAQNTPITINELPEKAQAFLREHFSGQSHDYLLKDAETFKVDYEVRLTNGTEIEFNKKGEWKEVNGNKIAIPVSVLPMSIASYLKTNHPDTFATKIEKETKGYEVKLDNGLELKFNSRGKFVKIDD